MRGARGFQPVELCKWVQRVQACEVAREHLKVSQANMKARFDQRGEACSFRPGDKV